MPDVRKVQYAFNAGQLNASALGRQELDHWQRALGICRNAVPRIAGGVENRPGLEHVAYESQPQVTAKPLNGLTTTFDYTASSATNPVVITISGAVPLYGNTVGDGYVAAILTCAGGAAELGGVVGEIRSLTSNTFEILGHDATADTASHTGEVVFFEKSRQVRELPFQFGVDDTYACYLGHKWMMPVKDGAHILFDHASHGLTALAGEVEYLNAGECLAITPASGDHGLWFGDSVWVGTMANSIEPAAHGDKRYEVILDVHSDTQDIVAIVVDTSNVIEITMFAPHGWATGDRVYFHDTFFHFWDPVNRDFPVSYQIEVTAADKFKLKDREGAYVPGDEHVDQVSYASGVSQINPAFFHLAGTGGNFTGVVNGAVTVDFTPFFKLPTMWEDQDLDALDYAQDTDTITITSALAAQHDMTRTADDSWTLVQKDFIPSIEPPQNITPSLAGSVRRVAITTVSKESGEESLPQEQWVGTHAAQALTWDDVIDAFEFNIYVTTALWDTLGFHGLTDTQEITIDMSAAEATPDRTSRPPIFTNPFVKRGAEHTITGITGAQPAVITIAAGPHGVIVGRPFLVEGVAGMTVFNNKQLICEAETNTTLDVKYSDTTGSTAWASGGTVVELDYDSPRAVAYFQNRLMFARTPGKPQGFWFSRSGAFNSFSESHPIVDSDAIDEQLRDVEQNAILFIIPMNDVVLMTAGGLYTLIGDERGVLVPGATTPVPQPEGGVAQVKPVRFGDALIYVGREGNRIFEFIVNTDANLSRSYASGELSILVRELLEGREIKEMTKSKVPYPAVWMTRDDGILLGISYAREHKVFAWHRHDTQGQFESLTSVPEGKFTGFYVSVKRKFGGLTKRHFERFHNRDWVDPQDAFFVDSGVKYDEPFPCTTDAGFLDPLRLFPTAGSHTFAVGDFLDMEHKIQGREGFESGLLDGKRYVVKAFAATYIELETTDDPAVDLDGTAAISDVETTTLTAHRCTLTPDGYDHLVGETVAILADGYEDDEQVVDSLGGLTFTVPHSRVIAGKRIQAQVETLRPDAPAGPFTSLHGSKMRTQGQLSLELYRTLGLKIGPGPEHLREQTWAEGTPYDGPIVPVSGRRFVPVDSVWGEGKILIQQDAPLPFTIQSMGTELEIETNEDD